MVAGPDPKFPVGFAVSLDLVRVAAALAVLLGHVLPVLGIGKLFPADGHDAVAVFFVLSGFVTASACDRKDAGWRRAWLKQATAGQPYHLGRLKG